MWKWDPQIQFDVRKRFFKQRDTFCVLGGQIEYGIELDLESAHALCERNIQ